MGYFTDSYTRAREAAAHLLCSELIAIIDDTSGDFTTTEDGRRVCNGDAIQRSRLKFDGRRWIISKLLPKQYGDRTETAVSGQITVQHENVGDLELARWIALKLSRAATEQRRQIEAKSLNTDDVEETGE
jgi:hypothetical protein